MYVGGCEEVGHFLIGIFVSSVVALFDFLFI